MIAKEIFLATLYGLNWRNPKAWAYLLREFMLMVKDYNGNNS